MASKKSSGSNKGASSGNVNVSIPASTAKDLLVALEAALSGGGGGGGKNAALALKGADAKKGGGGGKGKWTPKGKK